MLPKERGIEKTLGLLLKALQDTYIQGALKSGDPLKPEGAILLEHFSGFISFRRQCGEILKEHLGIKGEEIGIGLILSQAFSLRRYHGLPQPNLSAFSPLSLSVALELEEKQFKTDEKGKPHFVWDDLGELSLESKEALLAEQITSLRVSKKCLEQRQYPGVDENGNPKSVIESVRSNAETVQKVIRYMPPDNLKLLPLLKEEMQEIQEKLKGASSAIKAGTAPKRYPGSEPGVV